MATKNNDTIHDLAYLGTFGILKYKINDDTANATKLDSNERMPIHWAALGGHTKIVEYLVGLNSPVDPRDDSGATPLLLASSAGKVSVVKYLLSRGADPNLSNNGGHSPLQYASSKGWQEIVELLLDNDANANSKDERGATPLHRAASMGTKSIIELLVQKGGANLNVTDLYGNTPLHLACEEEHAEAALYLITLGALTDIANKEKKTALELAPRPLARKLQEAIEIGQPSSTSG